MENPPRTGFFRTVKFKVALWYAVLYTVSAAVSFLLLYSYLRNDMLQRFDAELAETATQLGSEYLAGARGKNYGIPIPVAKIPAGHLELFRRKFPGFAPLLAFESRVGNDRFLNVLGAADGKLYQVRLEHDDSVYSRLVEIAHNLPALRKTFLERAAEAGSENVFYALADSDGKLVLHTALPESFRPEDFTGGGVRRRPAERFYNGRPFRVLELPVFGDRTLIVGGSLMPIHRQLDYFASQYAVIALLVLIPAILCGWLVARHFIAGVRRVSETAQRIAGGGDFSQRVTAGNEGAEIDEMVAAFNHMTANTEHLFGELRIVTDNIAHDLKTPLTRMRGLAEVTVRGPLPPAAGREALGNIAEECDNMVAMINNMLEITRTETRLDARDFEMIDFAAMLRQACDLFESLAFDKGNKLEAEIPEQPAMLPGDKYKLQRLISNLVDNAIKFTPMGGVIRVKLAIQEGKALFTVQDSGPGIEDKDKERVFDRFYRCDSSRTLPGNGLGLPMVRAIVSAHHGSIRVIDAPETGAVFEVTLPLE